MLKALSVSAGAYVRSQRVTLDGWLHFSAPPRTAVLLRELRKARPSPTSALCPPYICSGSALCPLYARAGPPGAARLLVD